MMFYRRYPRELRQTAASFPLLPSVQSECVDGLDYVVDLLVGEFREDRQAEAGRAGLLGDRQAAGGVTERGIAFLAVHRAGIDDLGADTVLLEVRAQFIAARMQQRELVPHALS